MSANDPDGSREIGSAGQRIDMIRFGSRVDVHLPEGTRALAATAKNAGAAEREVRHLMPYELVTPDPLEEAVARFREQMRRQ